MSLAVVVRKSYSEQKVSKEIVRQRAYLNIGGIAPYNKEKEHRIEVARGFYNNSLYGLESGNNDR